MLDEEVPASCEVHVQEPCTDVLGVLFLPFFEYFSYLNCRLLMYIFCLILQGKNNISHEQNWTMPYTTNVT